MMERTVVGVQSRFGENLRSCRRAAGLSQEGLAFASELRAFDRSLPDLRSCFAIDPAAAHKLSADGFDPPKWKPRVPNPAFRRARPDDTFWAARRVMAFTDEMIRFSSPFVPAVSAGPKILRRPSQTR